MISYIDAISSGNAVRLILSPPAGATEIRVLRRTSDSFTGESDAGAHVVADGDVHSVIDTAGLVNKTLYFYKPYALVGGGWVAGPTVSCTPDATFLDQSDYPLLILRDRIFAGLKVETDRGTLQHRNGAIPVLLSSPTFEDSNWPIVTLQLAGDNSEGERFIGDFETDEQLADGNYNVQTGWMGQVSVAIAAWSLNPDARRTLRRSIGTILRSNALVFEEMGLYHMSVQQDDQDDYASYPAPVYQSISTVSCLADESVMSQSSPIRSITVTADAVFP
jgi:hypothetical protein